MSDNKKIIILGAGITGLTTAYLLSKKGFDVTVLEKRDEVGGSMESVRIEGNLFDRGPNSGLETTPLIGQLVEELNLQDTLNKVVQSIKSLLLSSKATLTVDFDEVPTIFFNKAYLESILLNLITNSIKYVRTGFCPEISISSELLGSSK